MPADRYLRFWGVRGSYATPDVNQLKIGGNTSCVEVHVDGHTLICDAGTGIIPLGKRLMSGPPADQLMLIFSHYHWDHICGFAFFDPAFQTNRRIKIFGPGGSDKAIEERLSETMKAPYFPVQLVGNYATNLEYIEMPNNRFQFGPMELYYKNVHHPGVTFGYQISIGEKTIAYVPDHEITFLAKTIEQSYDEFDDQERGLLDRMKSEVRMRELDVFKGVDILIHDAQYTPEDYNAKRGWGHSCYIETVNAAIDAGVGTLYLFHHDPDYNDEKVEEIHQHALQIIQQRGSPMRCEIAKEGLIIDLS